MPRRNAVSIGVAALAALIFTQAPAAQSDFRRSLSEVSKQQRVEVLWAGGPYRYEYDWGGGSAVDPTEDEVARVASAIARELLLYPDGLLERAALRAVVLVRDLHVSEEGASRGAAAYVFEDRLFLDVTSAQRAIQADTRVRFVHHILWHRLDERAGTMWKDPEWVALNPAGFEYGVHSRGGVHESRAGAGSLSTQYPGFLNLYSTGNLPDDKAEVFAYLMVIHPWLQQRAAQDPFLRRKIDLMKARLTATERSFDNAFWRRIDGTSDDASRYGAVH